MDSNTKRIAKNTFFLYIRTFFVLLVSLYMSRVVLQVLGVEDYGIYQVVGGLVTMFSVISGTLSAAVSRFITFEIGNNDEKRLKRIFSTSVVIQFFIAFLIFVVAEIIAMWFIHTRMQIPGGRMEAAEWVFHLSLAMFCINLISIPYNAAIIAHEHMKAFAYISIFDVSLKLAICFLTAFSPIDKLVFFAVLMTASALIVRLIYSLYCHRHFKESRGKLLFDKTMFKEMIGFSGWTFFTNTNSILNTQGVNMLINVFFGVTVNAARGIATQVEGAVLQFVTSFTTAINPQITKSYAAGDMKRMYTLVCRGAKFSYLAFFAMVLPIMCETEFILNTWLTVVPEHTVIFMQLSLVLGMFDCMGSSGYTACTATGKMRRYALILTPIGLLEFPLVWIFFLWGAPVVSAYYLYILVKALVFIARMFLMRDLIGLKPSIFVHDVIRPVILTTSFAIIPSILVVSFLPSSTLRFCISMFVGVFSVLTMSFWVGLTLIEREMFMEWLRSFLKQRKR